MTPTRQRRGRRTVLPVVFVLLCASLFAVAAVLVEAIATPGAEGPAATVAEWARDNGLNGVVTWLEQIQYVADQPATGGAPAGGIPVVPVATAAVPTAAPPPLTPLAGGTALAGEGRWQIVVVSGGRPAVAVTTLRPDAQHTSYLAGVMRLDPRLVRGQLHPGTTEPRGTWQASTSLQGTDLTSVAAVFNGGFKLSDPSHNGYFAEGRVVSPLIPGKASLVLYADGAADVGAWGSEVRMTPDVASVRQNLLPLVDGGHVNPSCATGGTREWGSTIGQAAYIDRSGFGVTADGTEIYVAGPALSVCTLGAILADAGVVRGMELDINPAWLSAAYFPHAPGQQLLGYRLYPAERVPPTHYLQPTSRDWYAWYIRF